MRLCPACSLHGAALRAGAAAAALAVAAGCVFGDRSGGDGPITLVTPAEADALIADHAADAGFVIIDVRTSSEYAAGHIENAVNIDRWAADFEEQLDALDRAGTYLVYCASGTRSAYATTLMVELGFTGIYELAGGLDAWIAASYPVVP